MNDVNKMLHVLKKEKEAIETMMILEQHDLTSIIEKMYQCTGRIVFCGIGKSGIIARKLAATFASTGSHSLFLHASEALHGDLGMIQSGDIIVFLSNSGESEEVLHVISALKQMDISSIAMTSKATSTLASNCDYTLLLPDVEEADYIHVAPTVSSICMLALGDALACTIMEKKHFNKKQFHAFHPGGSLGKQLEELYE